MGTARWGPRGRRVRSELMVQAWDQASERTRETEAGNGRQTFHSELGAHRQAVLATSSQGRACSHSCYRVGMEVSWKAKCLEGRG